VPDEHPHTADLDDQAPDQRVAPRPPQLVVVPHQELVDSEEGRPAPWRVAGVAQTLRDEALSLREMAGAPEDSVGFWHTLTGTAARLERLADELER
jgi:hypothetical protein